MNQVISTSEWGPTFWSFLHLVSSKYPDNPKSKDRKNIEKLINSLSYIIPCHICRNHFSNNLKLNQLTINDTNSKTNIIQWFINFHNIVNRMLKKKEYTYDEVILEINKNNNKYNSIFCDVLNYISYGIDEPLSFEQSNNIIAFIDSSIYFGNIEYIFDSFKNVETYNKSLNKFKKYVLN
jgi:hypothetical protein